MREQKPTPLAKNDADRPFMSPAPEVSLEDISRGDASSQPPKVGHPPTRFLPAAAFAQTPTEWLDEADPALQPTQVLSKPEWLIGLLEADPALQPTQVLSTDVFTQTPTEWLDEADPALQPTQVLSPDYLQQAQSEWLSDLLKAQADLLPKQPLPSISREEEQYEELPYYRFWLKNEFKRQNSPYSQSARASYVAQSSAPVQIRGQPAYPFAPLRGRFSALTE